MEIPAGAAAVDMRGLDEPTVVVCPRCLGRGKTVPIAAISLDGSPIEPETCTLCGGHRIVYQKISWEPIPPYLRDAPCRVREPDDLRPHDHHH